MVISMNCTRPAILDPHDELIALKDFPKEQLPREPKTIKDWIERRGFPKPYAFGPRWRRWSTKEIRAWKSSRQTTAA
jgi:hypothetical protein